jgi:membrane-bound metal-dependent hydrolase YbcI (DUF457 family)
MLAGDLGALAGVGARGWGRLAGLATGELLVVAATATGAALLPDIDEPGSTVAHLAEPVTGLVARITKRVAGGHRVGTHSLLAVALAGLSTWALSLVTLSHTGVPGSVVPLGLCLALAIRGLIPRLFRPGHLVSLFLAAGATWWIESHVGIGLWLPLAIAGGWALHLGGDWLTKSGIPLFWPVSKRHFAWPILDHTNSWRERVIGLGLLAATVALAWAPVASFVATVRP